MNYLLWLYLTIFRAKEIDEQRKVKEWQKIPIVTCKKCHGRGKLTMTADGICLHCARLAQGQVYPTMTEIVRKEPIPPYILFQICVICIAMTVYVYRTIYSVAT